MDEYRLLRMIGEGTFGQVYEAEHRRTQLSVAIKLVPLTYADDCTSGEKDVATSSRELEALQLCQHPNVIQLLAHFVHQHSLALVLPHMDCDLSQLLRYCQHTATPLTLHTTRIIAHQLLTAVAHIHSLGVLHRDIKPSNLLLSSLLTVGSQRPLIALADFGQASVLTAAGRPLSPAVSTRWYKPPELLLPSDVSVGQQQYGSGADMWAVGCVLAECVSGAVLLAGSSDVEQLSRIAAMCGREGGERGWDVVEEGRGVRALLAEEGGTEVESGLQCEVVELLDSMLQWESTKRITAQQALSHPFFTRTDTTSQPADLIALINRFQQARAERSRPLAPTSESLQQPLTIRHISQHCPPDFYTTQRLDNTTVS